jgi:hypothetical protein
LPFFTVLRGSIKIEWGVEQQKAFESVKSYLEKLPTLSSLEQRHLLILYISATHAAVSGALVIEKERSSPTVKQRSNNSQCTSFQRSSQDPRDFIQK